MSAAHKYKHYVPETPKHDAKEIMEQKKVIQDLRNKITEKLIEDVNLQKRAASILEKLINS
jgi:hypothetical protein